MTFPRVSGRFSSYHALTSGTCMRGSVVQDAKKMSVVSHFLDHVLCHHVKPRVRVDFAPGMHDLKRTQWSVTHVDNATDHHAWVVLRLLVEKVQGEPLVSGGEVFRHPSVDPHTLVLRHQLLAASHESLVLEAEPRWIQCHVIWDAPQIHWNASVHALQLIETVRATQRVNAEIHVTVAVH